MTKLNYRHINSLADDYEMLLFDLWGVILEGEVTYHGVVSCINNLAKRKKLFFLTNAPRPKHKVALTLQNFGLNTDGDMILTSGDVALQMIKEFSIEHSIETPRIFHLGQDRNPDLLDEFNHILETDINDANIMLISNYLDDFEDLEQYDQILKQAAERDILCICANPDVTIPKQNTTRYCAGYFAAKIERFGGNVIYTGKPHLDIYKLAFGQAPNLEKSKILMIGDTMDMDIKGAMNAGIHSALVLTGNSQKIHRNAPKIEDKIHLIEQYAKTNNIYPHHITSLT